MDPPLRVLVVDDEPNIRKALTICLQGAGCEVLIASNGREALATARHGLLDLILLDLRLGEEEGLELLPHLRELTPGVSVLVMTAYASLESAVQALRAGAVDYLQKPFSPVIVRSHVERALRLRTLESRVRALEHEVEEGIPPLLLETRSALLRRTLETLGRAASEDVPLLLVGERGAGKSTLARWIHARSARPHGPFVVLGAGRPHTLQDSLHGTLAIEEVADLSPDAQAELLQRLRSTEQPELGGPGIGRVVAGTRRELESEVRAGRFSGELLETLSPLSIELLPLRSRPEDIPLLAQHFLAFFSRALGRPAMVLDPLAEERLVAHTWPGNVRELRSEIERAILLVPGDTVRAEDLSERLRHPGARSPTLGGDFTLAEIERAHIDRVLARSRSREAAAQQLGIDPSTLWRKLKRYARD